MAHFATDLAHEFRVVSGFVRLMLLAVVALWLWTLLGFCVSVVCFISEASTALDPPMANNVAVAAVAFELPLDFFGGYELSGVGIA